MYVLYRPLLKPTLGEKSGFTEQHIHGRFIYFEKVQVKESLLDR
jgi:hypothetical protein